MNAVAQALTQLYNDNAFRRVIYTESHDEVANGKSRVPEEIMPGAADSWFPKKRATLGAALVMTAPGIPMLFQGQEFLADGAFSDAEPLQWQHAEERAGLVGFYRDLIQLRRNFGGHTRGLLGQHTKVFHVNNDDKLVAFGRQSGEGGPGDTTVVLANFANQAHDAYTIGLPGPGNWQVRFNSDWQGYDGEFGDMPSFGMDAVAGEYDGFAWHGSIAIAPYAVLILSQEG
jgi:1,4-alpha-glucan branching enzyme